MSLSHTPRAEEVEHLLRNAELRDELELLADESIMRIDTRHLTTPVENDFLAAMLAWEHAPVLPIGRWFEPELQLPSPDTLDEARLSQLLRETIHRLFEKRIVLDFTDHLSDRQLYTLIYRDILPAHEKKIDSSRHFLHWDCANVSDDPETWLRYYASEEDRENWSLETGESPPEPAQPPYCRNLPRAPL